MKTESVVSGKRRFRWFAAMGLAGVFALLAFGTNGTLTARAAASGTRAASGPQEPAIPTVALKAPDPSTIPQGKLGESIRLGRNIMINTPKYAARYVGDKMNCVDCHLNEGTQAYSSPLAGITTVFPAYTRRDGRVITIEHRIQECFERSENGTPPPSNSPEMVAIVAYMNWLSKGIPMGSTVKGRGLVKLTPPAHVDSAAGATIYAHQCEVCHGAKGQGIPGSFPPLWGPGSFNDGAGMSKVAKMAAFVKANMPKTSPGSLSVQQAYDVAAFATAKPHTHFKQAK
ncbi:MAG: c-type cytochrome [Acidobacteriota bacterium]